MPRLFNHDLSGGRMERRFAIVTTCWQLDLHVLTDDRPASSNPSLQGGCSAHARFRWVFLTTEHCKLDADYIKPQIGTVKQCNNSENRTYYQNPTTEVTQTRFLSLSDILLNICVLT